MLEAILLRYVESVRFRPELLSVDPTHYCYSVTRCYGLGAWTLSIDSMRHTLVLKLGALLRDKDKDTDGGCVRGHWSTLFGAAAAAGVAVRGLWSLNAPPSRV